MKVCIFEKGMSDRGPVTVRAPRKDCLSLRNARQGHHDWTGDSRCDQKEHGSDHDGHTW